MKARTLAILLILLGAVSVSALLVGSVRLTPAELVGAINGSDPTARVIVFSLRLPRLIAAMLAGSALAVSGVILQTITGNDLCAPNVIGVNSGAGLAVMLFLSFFPMQWRLLPAAAFFGALAATLAVMLVVRLIGDGSRATPVLAGVAISSLASAGISFLSQRDPDLLASYTAFSVGGFAGVGIDELAIPALMIALCFTLALVISPRLGLLRLGDDIASTLGVNVRALRALAMLLSSGLCAAAVSFAGLLGFVGLIVPHIARRLTSAELSATLVFSALAGAILTTLSDLIGRVISAPGELAAGVIMAMIGAPFFLVLLAKRR